MIKLLAVSLSAAIAGLLVWWWGWATLLIYPACALLTLLFSTEAQDPADEQAARAEDHQGARPSRL